MSVTDGQTDRQKDINNIAKTIKPRKDLTAVQDINDWNMRDFELSLQKQKLRPNLVE